MSTTTRDFEYIDSKHTLARCRSCRRGKARMVYRDAKHLPAPFWFVECTFCLASAQDGDTEQWAAEHWNDINGRMNRSAAQ